MKPKKGKVKAEVRATPPAAPGAPLSRAWAMAVLALLVVVFFHEVVVGGKTFLSPDATAPAGFAAIGERALYQDRIYPLWNPFVFLGMPSFASGTYNPLIYPPDWPLAILQKILPLPELTWMLLYYFIAAAGTFLLAVEWGARRDAALIGAAAFVFAPNLVAVGAHGHGSQLVDSAYLPVMLWLTARAMRTGSLSDYGWLGLAGGFQLLRGHVQICFYTWIAIALYLLVVLIAGARDPGGLARRGLRAGGVAAAGVLSFAVSAFYTLPLRDYAKFSIRGGGGDGGVGFDYATQWSLAPYEMPSIVVPGWTGFGGGTYWGGMPFTDYPNAYMGAVAVLLALPALFARGAPRRFALVLAAFALMVAFGKHFPLYPFLYDHMPLFNKFRVPVMVVVLFQLAIALGAAWGWSAWIERPRGDAKASGGRGLIIAAGVVAAVFVIGVLGQDMWRDAYVSLATRLGSERGAEYPANAAAIAYGGFVSDLGRACLLAFGALALGWLVRTRRIPVAGASLGVLALVLIELWPVSGRVMAPVIADPVVRDRTLGRDDVVEFLEQAGPPGSFRVLPVQEYQSNRYSGFGIATVGGYHAAKPRIFQDLFDARLTDNLGWMRLLNVRYIVLPQQLDPVPPYLREVHVGSQAVYENLLALPRVTLLGDYHVVTPAIAILDSVRDGTSDSERTTFLESDPGVTLGPIEGGRATLTHYGLNDVTVEVETPGPAILRLADLWHPDWTVTVDGKAEPLLKADYLLRAVVVPAGRHEVVFRFTPPVMRLGLGVSALGLLVSLGLVVAGPLRRRIAAQGPPPGAPEDDGEAAERAEG